VKEVRFEKLFSLAKYNNERIGFTAEVEEGENPNAVTGQLHFKILAIEDCLNAWRRVLSGVEYAVSEVENTEGYIRETKSQMKRMKVEIAELVAKAEKGDVDSRFRHACSRDSYKKLTEDLVRQEENLEKWNRNLELFVNAKHTLKQRIKEGNFSLAGVEIPKFPRRF